jgi:hypothetical protein
MKKERASLHSQKITSPHSHQLTKQNRIKTRTISINVSSILLVVSNELETDEVIPSVCSEIARNFIATANCPPLVLSRQSTQFVRRTPRC